MSCDNAAKGAYTDYTLFVTPDGQKSVYSDNSDDSIYSVENEIEFTPSEKVDDATGLLLSSAKIKNWVGYGDTIDVMPFTLYSPAEWNITLDADVPKSVTMTLHNLVLDNETGKFQFNKIASSKANSDGMIFFNENLATGIYALTVTCNDKKQDNLDTGYTLALDEIKKIKTIDLSDNSLITLDKNETVSFTLNSVQQLSMNKVGNLQLWQLNEKNSKVTIKPSYDKKSKSYNTVLLPGTYFLSASKIMYDIDLNTTFLDQYGSALFTDNNTLSKATSLITSESSFVGYGDGVDCYKFTVGADSILTPGDITISLCRSIENYATVTVYEKITKKGKEIFKKLKSFVHKTGIQTDTVFEDFTDGEYYIKIESKSYKNFKDSLTT